MLNLLAFTAHPRLPCHAVILPAFSRRTRMLRILGSPKRLCDGLTRRDMLWAGGLGLFGLGLSDYLHLIDLQAADAAHRPAARGFGKAKACILLFLYGSPSQLETFDMKPDAPV